MLDEGHKELSSDNNGSRGQNSNSSRGQNSGNRGGSNSGSSGSTNGERKPYIPRCQICRGDHYADKCPQFFDARQAVSSAHLAQAFSSACNVSDSAPDWYLDSGATAHMTSQSTTLDSYEPYSGNGSVIVGNGNTLDISHIGSSKLSDDVKLLDVLVEPHITKNLLSISKLTSDSPVDVIFSDKLFTIQNRVTKQVLAQGRCDKGLYLLDKGVPALVVAVRNKELKASFHLWHLRLGHVPFPVISLLNKLGHLSITSALPSSNVCSSCQLAKSKRLSFQLNEKCANNVLDLIHCDLWGPAPVSTADGFRYYVAFIDDYSRFCWTDESIWRN